MDAQEKLREVGNRDRTIQNILWRLVATEAHDDAKGQSIETWSLGGI